jgi:NADPH-dependent glutamate synthase beta subunit-like oxidoreductase
MKSNDNIVINRELCYVCGSCVERCVLDNLRMYLAPCRHACPVYMNCQGYVHLLAQGKEEEAAREIRNDMPFAGIVGRVCTRPCEASCERKKIDGQPVHIRALKRYLADTKPNICQENRLVNQKSDKRVAIIGSGPAGLMAAHELAVFGHNVCVFDSASEPGGMLRWGIPAFRLPVEEVTYAIKMLEKMEVTFQTGRTLGKDLVLDKLEREWDAIFLAIGAGPSARLNIPGEEIDGVYFGLDLLQKTREGKTPDIGNSVIVIGGGNSAVDSALTCKRLGAADVSIICLEEKDEMPAFQSELQEAYEENILVQNCWGPTKISRHDNGQLCVELSRCLRLFDDKGNFSPTLENTCGFMPVADSVVIAIGQRFHKPVTPDDLLDKNGNRLRADPVTMQTARYKVFAGGDAVVGSGNVIEAMANGREAAISINRMLNEETLGWGRKYWDGAYITDFSIDSSTTVSRERKILPRIDVGERKLHSEVEKTMSPEDARKEAERCLNCGYPAEVNNTCWSCLPCEVECPVDALKVHMPYLIR